MNLTKTPNDVWIFIVNDLFLHWNFSYRRTSVLVCVLDLLLIVSKVYRSGKNLFKNLIFLTKNIPDLAIIVSWDVCAESIYHFWSPDGTMLYINFSSVSFFHWTQNKTFWRMLEKRQTLTSIAGTEKCGCFSHHLCCTSAFVFSRRAGLEKVKGE